MSAVHNQGIIALKFTKATIESWPSCRKGTQLGTQLLTFGLSCGVLCIDLNVFIAEIATPGCAMTMIFSNIHFYLDCAMF